jgi:hypothetical protein
MALQLGALRNALIEAGATPVSADKAAEEVAGYEREFYSLRSDMARGFDSVRSEMSSDRAEVAREFNAVRSEMAHEFNALRTEMANGFNGARAELAHESNAIRTEMAQGFASVRGDRDDMRSEMVDMKSDIKVLKWAQAVTIAGVLAILLKTFFH